MGKLFCTNERAEDLLGWSSRLDTLGHIVSFFGYNDRDGEFLTVCGESWGMIISDYAKAIEQTVGEAYSVLNKFFEDESVSEDLRRSLKHLQRGFYTPHDVEAAEGALERIKAFEQEALNIASLRPAFLDIREAAIKQFGRPEEKKAHAAVQAA